MSSMNRVTLIGNLGQDPELRYTQNGTPVANFSLATTEAWTSKEDGTTKKETTWHRVVAWRKTGELAAQYLTKGSKACIEGRIQHRQWQDQEGRDRVSVEIVADKVIFLDSRDRSERSDSRPNGNWPDSRNERDAGAHDYKDADIPF